MNAVMPLSEIREELYCSLENLLIDLLAIESLTYCRMPEAYGTDIQQAALRRLKDFLDQHAGDVRDAGRILLHYAQKSAVSE